MTAPADSLDPVRRGRLFAAVAGVVVLFLAASSVPSPLYVVYQAQWGFSAATLTAIFAVYVVFLLASLLVVGGLSDHVGRRPVLAVALGVQTVAVVLFLLATNVTMLLVARAVQGAATGAAITAMAATLVDLSPRRAGLANATTPLIGLALGALGCGLLVEYAPAPTRLVYGVLLLGFAVVGVVLALLPETAPRRTGALASLRPRVRIPAGLRAEVLAIVPTLAASWALGGLYLSLGPSVAAEILGLRSHLVGGVVVTLLCGVGAVTAVAVLRRSPRRCSPLRAGCSPSAPSSRWAGSCSVSRSAPPRAPSSPASGSAWPRWPASAPSPGSPPPRPAASSWPSPTSSPTWPSASRRWSRASRPCTSGCGPSPRSTASSSWPSA